MKRLIKASKDTKEIKSLVCPNCANKTLYDVDADIYDLNDIDYHDVFVCDECGSEFLAEPQSDGEIKFVEYDEED